MTLGDVCREAKDCITIHIKIYLGVHAYAQTHKEGYLKAVCIIFLKQPQTGREKLARQNTATSGQNTETHAISMSAILETALS